MTWCRNVLTFNFQLYTFNFQPLKMGAWRNGGDDDVNLPFLLTLSSISVLERWQKNSIIKLSTTRHFCWREYFQTMIIDQTLSKLRNPNARLSILKFIAIPAPSAQLPTQATPRPDSPLCQRKVIFVFKISIVTNHHWQNTNIQRGKA